VAAVGEERRRTDAEDIRRAPQQDSGTKKRDTPTGLSRFLMSAEIEHRQFPYFLTAF